MSFRAFLLLFFLFSFPLLAQEVPASVTVGEYADFLNAVASVDPHTLYHETMNEIIRTGDPGDYRYEVVEGAENLPITFVTWLNAARYCNWKEHASPEREEVTPETTETGSYRLNGTMTEFMTKNEGAHYVLLMKTMEGLDDPTLASSALGFSVIETNGGDQFDAANLLQFSYPDLGEEKLTAFDKVIGVVGILALIGGGGYAYYRSHCFSEQAGRITAKKQRQREAGIDAANRDREEEGRLEDANPRSQMVDDVTGNPTNTEDFAPDNRTWKKRIADWLRDREFSESIFREAHLIAYNENLADDSSHQRPSPWTRKAFLHWLTRSFYPYESLEEFKVKNPGYLAWLVQQHEAKITARDEIIAANEATIAGHLNTISQNVEKIQILEAGDESKEEVRRQRLAAYQIARQKKDAVESVFKKAIELEQRFVFLQQSTPESSVAVPSLAITALSPVAEAKRTSQKRPSELSVASSAGERELNHAAVLAMKGEAISATPLRKLVEVIRDHLIARFLWLEEVAHDAAKEKQEQFIGDQIKEHLGEIWRAYLHLVEGRNMLASKKNLLWSQLATLGSESSLFIPSERVTDINRSIASIRSKIESIPQELEIYLKKLNDSFLAVQREFEEDTKSIATRDSTARKSLTGTPNSPEKSGEKPLKKKKSILKKIFSFSTSSPASQLKEQKNSASELRTTTACLELEKRVEQAFFEQVFPIISDLENLHAISYQYLHLVEKKILQAYDLMKFYEADRGEVVVTTSHLIDDLKKRLLDAREKSKTVTDILNQVEGALGGTWQSATTEAGMSTYEHQGGGWGTIRREEELTKAINSFIGYRSQMNRISAEELQRAIEEVQAIADLLASAKEKADQLLIPQGSTVSAAKSDFLGAMEPLLHFSRVIILRPKLLPGDHDADKKENDK